MKKFSISGTLNGSSKLNGIAANRQKMNTEMRLEKMKLNANRRIRDQKRNFDKRSSEKQVIEERRKRREARIIETKVRNESRARINANNRAKRAEAEKNREYENKKRAQLKANTNSKRVKSLEKNYANLKTKAKNTLNRYNLNRKRAFIQLGSSQSKVNGLNKKLKSEIKRVDIERSVSAKLQSNLNAVTIQVEKSEQRINEIETERDALNKRIKLLQLDLETQSKSGGVVEVARLTKELNEANAEIEKLGKEVTTLMNNTETAVASATKELNLKLAQAAENKQKAINGLRANRNRKLQNKNAALMGAARNANAAKKELNAVRFQKEAALAKAATEKISAVAAAEKAAREATMAETATEKAAAEQKLKNAQAKINAANANKTQALAKAKINKQKAINGLRANRNLKLQNKNAILKKSALTEAKYKAARSEMNSKNAALKKAGNNKNVELASARMVAAATAKAAAQGEINAIRVEKEAALALANAEKKKAVAMAEEAAKAKAAANTQAEKNAAEKQAENARKARELAAKRVTNALTKAAAERKRVENANVRMKSILAVRAQKARNTVQKRSNEKAAAEKAAANKAATNAKLLKEQREAVQGRMAAAKTKANANAMATKKAKVVKMRKILATYKGTNPLRKDSVVRQGEDLIKQYENGKMVQIELGITKLVRNAKTRNTEVATGRLVTAQTSNAKTQFEARKKKEANDKEAARLARIETQKREGRKVTLTRAFTANLNKVARNKNDLDNRKAINEMKAVSNKKVVSKLVSGALAKAVKSGPVSTIYQSTTEANRRRVKDKVEEKVEARAYKSTWGIMIDEDGKDKAGLSKLENALNKKHILKQGIQDLPSQAFRKGRVPGSGTAARSALLTQVMRPYISGDDKYNEHKKQYNNAVKVYKNPVFGNTKSSKGNGVVTMNNVLISMKRPPVPPTGNKRPNGRALQRFRAAARTQVPPANPSMMAKAAQITMNKKKAVGNPALARQAYTNQGKFQRNMNIRKAAEGARNAAKGKLAREADKKRGWNRDTPKGRAKDRVSRTFPGGKNRPVMMRLRKRFHTRVDLVGTRPDAPNMNTVMTNVNRAAIEHKKNGAIKQFSLSKK